MTQRQGLLGGIAILSCAATVLQIALVRLYAAILGQHLAILAASFALLGLGLGGAILHLAPGIARPPAVLARLAYLAAATAAATVVALLVVLHVKPDGPLDAQALESIAVLYASSALPFVFAGIAVAAVVRHAPAQASALVPVLFASAATGALVAILGLRASAPRLCLGVTIAASVAALVFYATARRAAAPQRASGAIVSAVALASLVLLAGDLGAPWLRVPGLRWAAIDKVELQEWSELGLLTVDKPAAGVAWIRTDGTEGSPIYDLKTTPPAQPDEIGYVLVHDKGPVLVLDAGGGRAVRAAIRAGHKDIYAAEIDPLVVTAVMRGKYKTFSGDLYDKPEVHVVVADGRGYLRRAPVQFRSIVVSLPDTWTATAAGALALTAADLYTVEAFRDALDHLEPGGVLVVDRWTGELDRLVALAAAALRDVGEPAPAGTTGGALPRTTTQPGPDQHLFACGAARASSLLIKRTALTRDEIGLLRRHCKKNKFSEDFAPDVPHAELRRRLAEGVAPRLAAPASATDLTPPTGDRPFFFYAVPASLLPHALRDLAGLRADNQALLVEVALLGVALALALLVAALGGRGPARPMLYFGGFGGGSVLVTAVLVQSAAVFLGHPGYALSVGLVAVLGWAGVGGLLTARVAPGLAALAAGRRAQLLVAVLAALVVGLGPALDRLAGLPFAARLAILVALMAPPGLLMGAAAPLGLKLVAACLPAHLPWCWAIAWLAGVLALPVGALLAAHFGYSAALLAGAMAWLLAAAAVPVAPAGDASLEGAGDQPFGGPSQAT